jgi:hypothetical protein
LPVSFLGFLAGAGFAWNVGSARGRDDADDTAGHDWAALLDTHVFDDAAGGTGAAAIELGDSYRMTGATQKNGTALFFVLTHPQQDLENRRYRGLSADGLRATEEAIDHALATLHGARPRAQGGELVRRELRWVAALLRVGCHLATARLAAGATTPVESLPAAVRERLGEELAPLVAEHRALWLARNREGGRADSVSRLQRLQAMLAGGAAEGNAPA